MSQKKVIFEDHHDPHFWERECNNLCYVEEKDGEKKDQYLLSINDVEDIEKNVDGHEKQEKDHEEVVDPENHGDLSGEEVKNGMEEGKKNREKNLRNKMLMTSSEPKKLKSKKNDKERKTKTQSLVIRSNIMTKEEEEELKSLTRDRRTDQNRSITFVGINNKRKSYGVISNDVINPPPFSTSIFFPAGESVKDKKLLRHSVRFNSAYADTKGKREKMEDAILIMGQVRQDPMIDLFSIFDGHGGSHVSNFIAQNIPELLEKEIKKNRSNPKLALKKVFKKLNKMLVNEDLEGGSTVLISLIVDSVCYFANLGDSRAVAHCNGETKRVTIDHKPDNPNEQKRIEESGGQIQSSVNIDGQVVSRINGIIGVSRALGDFHLSKYISNEPDIFELDLNDEKCDYFILACDGLWDVMSDEDAIEIADQFVGIESFCLEAANRLRDVAYYRGSKDNISVVVIQKNEIFQNDNYKSKCILC